MTLTPDDAGELLRARGMRSTPQRRAILSAFHGGRTEHLSADEVYARASLSLPDLSRGTVYATLAEFSELGLLSALGSPEPVRYETNTNLHAHFRCRLCSRLFDLVGGQQDPESISDPGFIIERVETRAEGICDDCTRYDAGLSDGARSVKRLEAGPERPASPDTPALPDGPASPDTPDRLLDADVAAAELDSPLGPLLLAATPNGLIRLAFSDHADADALRARVRNRRGSATARQHLSDAAASLELYFSGVVSRPDCMIDWDHLPAPGSALRSTETIPYATHRSYSELDQPLSAYDLGYLFGTNPIPIFMPCHRVTRGTEIPSHFVGGTDRRRWLDAHEQSHPLT